jgi:hypothetical protein
MGNVRFFSLTNWQPSRSAQLISGFFVSGGIIKLYCPSHRVGSAHAASPTRSPGGPGGGPSNHLEPCQASTSKQKYPTRYRYMDDIEYQPFNIEGQCFSFDIGYDM